MPRPQLTACLIFFVALLPAAEDWPEWRGAGRQGVWSEQNLIKTFPPQGLKPTWRVPIHSGYSAPSIANGRVYVTDFANNTERLLCLDESTGRHLWSASWPADYRGIDYASGPRAAPTVDKDLVFVLGAAGHLAVHRTSDGALLWQTEYQRDFQSAVPPWGYASAPIVDGDRVIALPGGRPAAKVAAFDKRTGRILWRALDSTDSEPGYSQPILITATNRRQLIVWHTGAVVSLDPVSGQTIWEYPFKIHMNTPIATPTFSPPYLVVSGFFNGTRLLRIDGPAPELIWRSQTETERGDGIHALLNSPLIDNGYIYGIGSYGQLQCLKAATGQPVWESQAVTKEKTRNVSAYMIKNGNRWIFYNDRGELIFAELSPQGYREIGRTTLLKPTTTPGGRRELGAVNWTHPAFANKHVIVRNDEEIARFPLAPAAN